MSQKPHPEILMSDNSFDSCKINPTQFSLEPIRKFKIKTRVESPKILHALLKIR